MHFDSQKMGKLQEMSTHLTKTRKYGFYKGFEGPVPNHPQPFFAMGGGGAKV